MQFETIQPDGGKMNREKYLIHEDGSRRISAGISSRAIWKATGPAALTLKFAMGYALWYAEKSTFAEESNQRRLKLKINPRTDRTVL
ncbi:MAG: hypothetical protein CME32_23075 [Gimesia sp.]|nr:hypothetical protein [Gimesia sp.]